ncbi:ATP-binding cassette domain-containing protein [Labilibacter sediminis]|nr:ATP-binding cassette domain-containing protein [Labilibacter sediminis]
MSEGILKALIQLFALIAFPHKDNESRRNIVKNFLDQQLSHQMVEEYLRIYESHYQEHASKLEKLQKRETSRKTLTANSVKALRISHEINKELTHYQKLIVVIQLIEFLKSGIEISHFEWDFVTTIAETFHIDADEFLLLEEFVLGKKSTPSDNENFLVINNNTNFQHSKSRHLFCEHLRGELHILHIKSGGLYLLRTKNEPEISINGQLLTPDRVHVLTPGCSIRNTRINPIYFSDIVSKYTSDYISSPITFEVNNISYQFKNKTIGIQPMSFSSNSGKLVGIMGSSGAGKSTLTNILSGIYHPGKGSVKINDFDIHEKPEKIEGLIGYVSQDDLLMENLTVYQNLYYNAKLCFDNYSESAIVKKVLNLLTSLGLADIKDMKVGSPLNKKISGGQRKRLNIALELMREPSVLFLDEPTSGLSSRDSANILDLLKELALKGKLVFVVIHQPSSDIFKMFNQLLVLDDGGYLIYDGDPVESINYFKACIKQANRQESECNTCGNVNPEQILNIVNSQVIDEYGTFTRNRKIEPKEWYQKFNKDRAKQDSTKKETSKTLPSIHFKVPNWFKQLFVFIRRDILSKLSNRQYLIINLLETPVLALLLSSIIKYYNVDAANGHGYSFQNNPNIIVYIIMTVIIALFVGLTVSAEEIISDRKILKREEFLNLSRFSYILSKVIILTFLSGIQTFLLVLIGNSIIEIKDLFFEYWIVLFSVSVFANLLGLNISDSFKHAVNIYILIPFLIIPQIILSGVFISYDHLNPKYSNPDKIPWYGEVITARWAFEALTVNQFKNNKYTQNFYVYDKVKSESNFKKEYWVPTLQAKLDYCFKVFENKSEIELMAPTLQLLKNEIIKENTSGLINLQVDFIDLLTPENFDLDTYMRVKEYLKTKKDAYKRLFNKTDERLDIKKKKLTNTKEKRDSLNRVKNNHFNLELERFARNSNNIFSNKIIEYNGTLIQKTDPIYKMPKNSFIKAHFLSPYKKVGNLLIDTIKVNTLIIWLFNLLLFITLHMGILRKLLSNSSAFYSRIKKSNN